MNQAQKMKRTTTVHKGEERFKNFKVALNGEIKLSLINITPRNIEKIELLIVLMAWRF